MFVSVILLHCYCIYFSQVTPLKPLNSSLATHDDAVQTDPPALQSALTKKSQDHAPTIVSGCT